MPTDRLAAILQAYRFDQAVLVLITLWGLGSIVAVSARCDARHSVEFEGHCSGQVSHLNCAMAVNADFCLQFVRWGFIGIYDAVLEVIIFFLSFMLIWGLTMRLDPKIRVILAFIFRLPLVV